MGGCRQIQTCLYSAGQCRASAPYWHPLLCGVMLCLSLLRLLVLLLLQV